MHSEAPPVTNNHWFFGPSLVWLNWSKPIVIILFNHFNISDSDCTNTGHWCRSMNCSAAQTAHWRQTLWTLNIKRWAHYLKSVISNWGSEGITMIQWGVRVNDRTWVGWIIQNLTWWGQFTPNGFLLAVYWALPKSRQHQGCVCHQSRHRQSHISWGIPHYLNETTWCNDISTELLIFIVKAHMPGQNDTM